MGDTMSRTMTGKEVKFYDTHYGKEAMCPYCGSDVMWEDCWNCRDGYSHHDCGEDTCCCLDPYPNIVCDICNGEGGWYICINCKCNSSAEKMIYKEDDEK